MRGVRWVGDNNLFFPPETSGWGRKCETGRCHGEAARYVLAEVQGDIFARFHAVAAKLRSRTRNSQFGLLEQILLCYHKCCIDGGTSPEYFGYHLVYAVCHSFTRKFASIKPVKSNQYSPVFGTGFLLSKVSRVCLFVCLVRATCEWGWVWSSGGIVLTGEKQKYSEKDVSVLLCQSHTSQIALI
jgi:hypothetical protein